MDDIYTELSTVMEKGDERAAIDFIIKNIDKFSQKEQDQIITSLFEQALMNDEKKTALLHDFQSRALATANNIEKAKEILEKKEKLAEIKEGL